MNFLRILITISFFVLLACAPSHDLSSQPFLTEPASIVNGTAVKAKDLYAYHTVAITPQKINPCTGVIIAPHFILSAGHCKGSFDKGEIYFGLEAKKGKAVVVQIKSVTPHPSYCHECDLGGMAPGDFKDYAIVEFAEELPPGFKPVEFANLKQIKVGTIIHLAGFGIDENYKYDGIMKKTQVPVIAVGDFEFMTDEKKTGSCHGDSGGPAFILEGGKLYLAGITSRGEASCRGAGIYGMPAAEIEWIKRVISQ